MPDQLSNEISKTQSSIGTIDNSIALRRPSLSDQLSPTLRQRTIKFIQDQEVKRNCLVAYLGLLKFFDQKGTEIAKDRIETERKAALDLKLAQEQAASEQAEQKRKEAAARKEAWNKILQEARVKAGGPTEFDNSIVTLRPGVADLGDLTLAQFIGCLQASPWPTDPNGYRRVNFSQTLLSREYYVSVSLSYPATASTIKNLENEILSSIGFSYGTMTFYLDPSPEVTLLTHISAKDERKSIDTRAGSPMSWRENAMFLMGALGECQNIAVK